MEPEHDSRRELLVALVGVLRARQQQLARPSGGETHRAPRRRAKAQHSQLGSTPNAHDLAESSRTLSAKAVQALKNSVLAGTSPPRMHSNLAVTPDVLRHVRSVSRDLAKPLGISTAFGKNPVFALGAFGYGFRLPSVARDVTAFSSLRSHSGAVFLGKTAWRQLKVPDDLLVGVLRQPHLGELTGGLTAAATARRTTLGGLDWWRSNGSLRLMGGEAIRGVAFNPDRLYGGNLAALTRVAATLKQPAFAGALRQVGAAAAVGSVATVDARRLAGLAAGLDAGRLTRKSAVSWRDAGQPLQIADAMKSVLFATPETLLNRMLAEASVLPDTFADLDGPFDDDTGDDGLLAAAISAGQSLFEATAAASLSGAQWAWQVPLWWAPSLIRSWPTLTNQERAAVRSKAATATGALMTVAVAASAGQATLCLIAAVTAYGAIADFYGMVKQLGRPS